MSRLTSTANDMGYLTMEDPSYPGGSTSDKQNLYEPSARNKVTHFVCSKTKAVVTVILIVVFIIAISLVAAFARSACPPEVSQSAATTPVPSASSPSSPSHSIPTTLDKFPWKEIRLPSSITPESYHLHVTTDLEKFTFSGVVEITLNEIVEEADFIVLHCKDLNITKSKIKSNAVEESVSITEILEYSGHQQLYFKLSEKLKKGRVYVLSISYASSLDPKLTGYYRSSYKDDQGQQRWLSVTQFEATYARTAFPCFDEPSFKANFTMTMTHHKDYISLFNMPQKGGAVSAGGDMVTDHFETSVKMSTYLVAFVVCDYGKITKVTPSYTVNVYAPKHMMKAADWALEVATKVLPFYEEFFGQPYPLPKQDLIAIPDFEAGAMENWGLITYRMVDVLYDPAVATEYTKERVAIVVAHELGHQWFGNLVTMKWWNDLWLNEGFASYLEVKGVGHVQPDWDMDYKYVSKVDTALSLDSLVNSHPVSVEINDPDEISSIFDSISYDKGSSLIRMLATVVGKDVLKSGLKSYLDKFKYGNAQTEDLWDALNQAYKDSGSDNLRGSLNDVMNTWTTQMGYPLVTVKRNGDTVTATQERFYLKAYDPPTDKELKKLKLDSPYSGGYSWIVPLSHMSQNNRTSSLLWMPQDGAQSTQFKVAGDWFKVNVNQTAFYRVNYDPATWRALTKQLQTDHTVLSASCRSNLIEDAFALAKAGVLSSEVALNLTKYMSHDTDLMPWETATASIQKSLAVVTDNEEFTDLYKRYVVKLMKPVLTGLGYKDEGNHLTRFLRTRLFRVGVSVNETDIVNHALGLYHGWVKDPTQSLPSQLKGAVLQAGIQYGGETEWTHCWTALTTTSDPSEKQMLMSALAKTRDTALLERYLGYCLQSDKIKSQDATTVMRSVADNPKGRLLTWNFLKTNWDKVYEMFHDGPFMLSSLVKGVTSFLNTDALHDEVEQFFTEHKLTTDIAVKQALELIQAQSYWMKNHVQDIQSWLESELAE